MRRAAGPVKTRQQQIFGAPNGCITKDKYVFLVAGDSGLQ